jgi:hypothetical protein
MKTYEVRTILAITVIAWESLDSAMPISTFCHFCGDAVTIERRPPS